MVKNWIKNDIIIIVIWSNGITITKHEIEINLIFTNLLAVSIFLDVMFLGYYIAYILYFDKYVSFDENVFNLFYHISSIKSQHETIKAENRLNKKALLYWK